MGGGYIWGIYGGIYDMLVIDVASYDRGHLDIRTSEMSNSMNALLHIK